jgi:hypothetical protein
MTVTEEKRSGRIKGEEGSKITGVSFPLYLSTSDG